MPTTAQALALSLSVSPRTLDGLTDTQAGFTLQVCVIKKSRWPPGRNTPFAKHLLTMRPISKDAFLPLLPSSCSATANPHDPYLASVCNRLKPHHTLKPSQALGPPCFCLLLLIPFQNPLCPPCHLGPNLWAGEAHSLWPVISDDRSRGEGLMLELFQYFPRRHCYRAAQVPFVGYTLLVWAFDY